MRRFFGCNQRYGLVFDQRRYRIMTLYLSHPLHTGSTRAEGYTGKAWG
jgi:hypothetical protein